MDSWENIQRKQKKKEKIVIVICIAVFVVGIADEILSANGHALITVHNFNEVALTIIQVQATIFTLAIALMALISNKSDRYYMGVNYNDFLMNIRPLYLKQKNIILVSITLLGVSILLRIIGFNNVIIAVFFVECILIWCSIDLIYSMFSGKNKIEREILSYVSMLSGENTSISICAMEAYCNCWGREIGNQGKLEYERHSKVFWEFFESAFTEERSRETLLSCCNIIVTSSLAEKKGYIRGLRFLIECYEESAICLKKNKNAVKKGSPFDLLSIAYESVKQCLLDIDIESVDKHLTWSFFIDDVIFTCLALSDDDERRNSNDIHSVKDLCGLLGYREAIRNGRDNRKWHEIVSVFDRNNYYGDMSEKIIEIRSQCDFQFMQKSVLYGNTELVKMSLYERNLDDIRWMNNSHVIMVLKIHCYIYYLAFYESEAYVDEEIKKKCKLLLEDEIVRKGFYTFILYVIYNDKNIYGKGKETIDILNERLIELLMNELLFYEVVPVGIVKDGIIDDTVIDFSVFFTTYVSMLTADYSLLARVLPVTNIQYYNNSFRGKNRARVREKLKHFLSITSLDNSHLDQFSESALDSLDEVIAKLYKEYILNNAEIKEKKIDKDLKNNKLTIERNIQKQVLNELETLSCDGADQIKGSKSIRLALPVDTDIDQFANMHLQQFNKSVLKSIIKKLIDNGSLTVHEPFESEEKCVKYLNEKTNQIAIGSQYMLLDKCVILSQEVEDNLLQMKNFLYSGSNFIMFVKEGALEIKISNVIIDVQNEAIEESGIQYDKERDVYIMSSFFNPSVDFTEQEIKKYLDDSRRRVQIQIDYCMKVNKGIIGEVVMERQ